MRVHTKVVRGQSESLLAQVGLLTTDKSPSSGYFSRLLKKKKNMYKWKEHHSKRIIIQIKVLVCT